jgi:F-type H+-transporting ATPase subunit b
MPFCTSALAGVVPLGVMLAGESPIDLDATSLVQLVIFFVAFFILRGLVFRPVMRLFDAREQAMDGSRKQAEQMERDAEQTREKFEAELRRVRQQATEDREKLRAKAQQLARELTEEARRESTALLSSAKVKLELESKDARARTRAEVPGLARQIAEKLLGRGMS